MSTATTEAPNRPSRLTQLCTERVDGAMALANTGFGGFSLPWRNLQQHTDTWLPGDLVLVVAYTGSGKTTFLQNITEHWATQNVPTLVFGTEQEPKTLTLKQACMMAAIPFSDARRNRLDSKWKARLEAAIRAQGNAPNNLITYYPNPSPTTTEVINAITASARKGVRNFTIDYLGRMDYSDIRAGAEWEKVKIFARQLKTLAVREDVLIVPSAQIMSKGEDSCLVSHRPPLLSSVQGGQAIGQECDIGIGLYQPLKQNTTKEQLDAARKTGNVDPILEHCTAAANVLKNREDGSKRNCQALFWVKHNRFVMRQPDEKVMPERLRRSEYELDMAEKKRLQGKKHDEQHFFSRSGYDKQYEDIESDKAAGSSGASSGDAWDQ